MKFHHLAGCKMFQYQLKLVWKNRLALKVVMFAHCHLDDVILYTMKHVYHIPFGEKIYKNVYISKHLPKKT